MKLLRMESRTCLSLFLLYFVIFVSCSDSEPEEPRGSHMESGLVGNWKSYTRKKSRCYDPFRNSTHAVGNRGLRFDFKKSGEIDIYYFDDIKAATTWYVDPEYTEFTVENWSARNYAPHDQNSTYSYQFIEVDGEEFLEMTYHDKNSGCFTTWKYNVDGWDNW